MDLGANAIAQLQMPRDKISMKMCQEHVLDAKAMLVRKGNVLICIALLVDDRSCAGRFVSDKIGSVCQAGQIELFEDHAMQPSARTATSFTISIRCFRPLRRFVTWVEERCGDTGAVLSSPRDISAWLLLRKPTAE
jgi:hypothetical protein